MRAATGEAFHHDVGEDLLGASALGFAEGHCRSRLLSQGAIAGSGFQSGKQGRQVGHAVFSGLEVNMPGGYGLDVLLRCRLGICAMGHRLGFQKEIADPELGEPVRQCGIDAPAGLFGEPMGVPFHRGGMFLGDLAALQRGEGVL